MKRCVQVVSVMLGLLLLWGCGGGGTKKTPEQMVRDVLMRFADGYENEDVQSLGELFASEVKVNLGGSWTLVPKADLMDQLELAFSLAEVQSADVLDIGVAMVGETYANAILALQATAEAEGQTVTRRLTFAFSVQKFGDSWLIVEHADLTDYSTTS